MSLSKAKTWRDYKYQTQPVNEDQRAIEDGPLLIMNLDSSIQMST